MQQCQAIAALLGHRSMEMTLTYARIANRVVADEYNAVSAQIDALYNTAGTLWVPKTRPGVLNRSFARRVRIRAG
jgi:hypothetical protein